MLDDIKESSIKRDLRVVYRYMLLLEFFIPRTFSGLEKMRRRKIQI
jgi:hypothetical protein